MLITSCKKDKFTTVPQIKYKSVSPNVAFSNLPPTAQVIPVVTFEVTDSEGDLGFVTGKDTAKVFIKNLMTNKLDSLPFPNLNSAATKNFKADVNINMENFLTKSGRPIPYTDTLYYEIYIKDFAKNKSNVIKTSDPIFLKTP